MNYSWLYGSSFSASPELQTMAHVGDERDLILSILGGHLVGDIVGVDDSLRLGIFGVGVVRLLDIGLLLLAAGDQRQSHDQSQNQSKKLFHDS